MRGEMRRSMRGAGTWPTDIGWAGVRSGDGLLRRGYWDAGYDADGWVCVGDPGENMWHCHHLMSRVWAMIRDIYIEEMWRRTVISRARGLRTLRDTRTLILARPGSVRPLSDWFPMCVCCVSAGVYLLSVLPSHQGQRTLPHSWAQPSL